MGKLRIGLFFCLWCASVFADSIPIVYGTNADVQSTVQGLKWSELFPLDAPIATVTNTVHRDRLRFTNDANGYWSVTNLYPGNYRREFHGRFTVTTNWYEFPSTNGAVNADDPTYWRSATNGITQALTVAAGNARYGSVCIQVFTNKALAPWGAIDISASQTAGWQEVVDAMPRVTDYFSGYGGGKIVFAPSTYTLTTNVTFPNSFPWNIEVDCAGSVFLLKATRQNMTKGYFNVAVDNGGGLTNTLKIHVHDGIFAQEAMLNTNAIFSTIGWGKYHDNIFTTMYGLTNSQGAYSLNWEANVPNQPIACVGLAHDITGDLAAVNGSHANARLLCYNNVFFCLANALVCGSVESRISFNSFACVGMYNSTPPPADNHATIHFATNLWARDIGGAPTPLSSGAAIVAIGAGDSCIIAFNEFYACGIAAFGGARFYQNRLSICGYREADSDDFPSNPYIDAFEPSSGGIAGDTPFDDVHLTNSVSGTWMQPDGGHLGASVRARNGLATAPAIHLTYDGSTIYHAFSGGRVISTNGFSTAASGVYSGDASGLTNANATTLFGSGTVPPARLATANTFAIGASPALIAGEKLRVAGDVSVSGTVTNEVLAGSGVRYVQADANGKLYAVQGTNLTSGNFSTNASTGDATFYNNVFSQGALLTFGGVQTTNPSASFVLGSTAFDGGALEFYRAGGRHSSITGDTNVTTGSGIMVWGTNQSSANVQVPFLVANCDAGTFVSNALTAVSTLRVGSTLSVAGNSIFGAGLTNTVAAGITYNALQSPTNSSFAPDFNLGNTETNIGAAFTLSLPIHVNTALTMGQTTILIIRTNGTAGSPFALTSPTGVKGTGTAFVTNTTIVTVFAYGNEFTNYNYTPIY